MEEKNIKGEHIYLMGSVTLDEASRPHYFIKIGRTGDLRARMRNYETYNPSFLCFGNFQTPSRAYSEAIEDALATIHLAGRQKKTEWFEVDVKIYNMFKQLSSFDAVRKFVCLEQFFDFKIETFEARAFEEERPLVKKGYLDKALYFKLLRDEVS